MESLAKEIRSLRKSRGWTQTDLAKKIGVPMTTLASWEQGKYTPKFPALVRLSSVLGFQIDIPEDARNCLSEKLSRNSQDDDLLNKKLIVPVVGYVGAGGGISPIDDHAMGGGIDEVEAPPNSPTNTVAVIVKGHSMIPMFYEGMHVFYSQRLKNVEDYINSIPLIVHLDDDRKAIKTIIKGSKWGLYTLTSFNADPIADIRIESVSPIDWIKPILPPINE